MLRKFLRIGEEFCLHETIFLGRRSPGARAGDGAELHEIAFQPDQDLRRRPHKCEVAEFQQEHVGGRVLGTQNTVYLRGGASRSDTGAVGKNRLDDLPVTDVLLGLPDGRKEGLPRNLEGGRRRVARFIGNVGPPERTLEDILDFFDSLSTPPVFLGVGL